MACGAPAVMSAKRPLLRALLGLSLCLHVFSRAVADTDPLEKAVAAGMRPLYAAALAKTGSTLKPGTPAWEGSLAASASAFLAAKPDDCAPASWLAATCDARSLIDSSAAMTPGLEIGDTFLTVPVAATRPLRRGDVVAFHGPLAADPDMIYISRVIGLPGDRIGLHDGIVSIDGKDLVREPTGGTLTLDGQAGPLPRFTERMPDGRSYDVLGAAVTQPSDATAAAISTMAETTVPAGHYFTLGDNRPNALDSRYAASGLGPGLPALADIVGRVTLIYISKDPSRIGRRP